MKNLSKAFDQKPPTNNRMPDFLKEDNSLFEEYRNIFKPELWNEQTKNPK